MYLRRIRRAIDCCEVSCFVRCWNIHRKSRMYSNLAMLSLVRLLNWCVERWPRLCSAGFQARPTMCTRPAESGVLPRQGHSRRLPLPLPNDGKEGKGGKTIPSGEAAQRVVLAAGTAAILCCSNAWTQGWGLVVLWVAWFA